jgi:glycosyltransferase involved in cell wall biosynthesis
VVIPCYNLGEYVDEAVQSVLAQAFQDFEVIVVDDGSTDEATRSLLATYTAPKTRVLSTAHAGLAAARNVGIEHARGAYLCALDADDRLEPSFLSKTAAILDADPAVTFASAWLRTFGEEEWEWKPERCDLTTLLSENTVLTAALVRRDAVVAVGGYDVAMPVQGDEDWDLWLTLVSHGYRGTIVPEVLFNYRRRSGSMSTICWHGPGHLPLTTYRVSKHRDAYRSRLTDVLLRQDSETAALLRQNDELERYIATELEPSAAARRAELTLLVARIADADRAAKAGGLGEAGTADEAGSKAQHRLRDLEAALHATSREVAAFRASMSWRVTAPLRRAYGWWLRMHQRDSLQAPK